MPTAKQLLKAGVAAFLALVILATVLPAAADHANPRRWATTTGEVTEVTVIDRTGSFAWHAATQRAVTNWNAANTNLRLSWASAGGACGFEAHTINVCMGYANGYHAMAWYRWGEDGYLSGATVTLDTDKTAGSSGFAKDHLACHEIGHNLVVDHSTDTGSCMGGYVDSPNAHDHASLESTYGVWAGAVTTTTAAPPKCRARRCRSRA